MSPQVHNLQELRRSASLATKVFIQRDYSDGTICQFQTKFPPELDSRVRMSFPKPGTQAAMERGGGGAGLIQELLVQLLHVGELRNILNMVLLSPH